MPTNYDPFRELDRVATSLFAGRQSPSRMPMDLYREGNRYVLHADLPGIDPRSVDIDVDGQLLTIRAERQVPAVEDVKWIAHERQSQSFLRQLNLGQGIDIENITARYENGVLTVDIPVSPRARPRKIQVSTGDGETVVGQLDQDGGSSADEVTEAD
ncbi:heat-shock protein Hsp20 [Tersicoccus solisilvae]|uniref:Heat-shock protein Hsp20 n=1 Tax=Tersicoccus solisilvae TaxID=1882339 RepID=A0ABQ1PA77_9MICC|nr:Hsp20/alpha crystallin family protein [Tersicoccus solisilvae]GGC93286.1 heat-shock protein Hsp20 [Tersicoccus solisilvae]